MDDHQAESIEHLKQQVESLKLELRAAQQQTALGELVSTTTHEFNNVLMSILNYAKLGLRHTDVATRTKSLEKILGAAQRAEKITNSVLGMARNRGNEATPTNLANLVEETLVLLERELQKYRVSVEKFYETDRAAHAVGNQVQQVLLNLLTNARQAMPKGGSVLIRIAEDPMAGTIDLTVRDTGTGIPADQLPRIFDHGFTTKQGPDATGKGGTGVGLASCKEIVEQHGGKMRVESTVGKGTAITIKFPAFSAEQQSITKQPIAPLGVPTQGNTTSASA